MFHPMRRVHTLALAIKHTHTKCVSPAAAAIKCLWWCIFSLLDASRDRKSMLHRKKLKLALVCCLLIEVRQNILLIRVSFCDLWPFILGMWVNFILVAGVLFKNLLRFEGDANKGGKKPFILPLGTNDSRERGRYADSFADWYDESGIVISLEVSKVFIRRF